MAKPKSNEFRRIDHIKVRDDLYLRDGHDPVLVQRYSEDLEALPPIEINQHDELIDGYHRVLAHQTIGVEQIPVTVTETHSDLDISSRATLANSKHGWPLTSSERKDAAIFLHADGTGRTKRQIAELLSVSERTIRNYLVEPEKRLREKRNQRILDLHLECYTQQEIADRLGISQQSVASSIKSFTEKGSASDFDRDPDFKPKLYDVWNFGKLSNKVKHPGNSEQRILEELIYRHTQPYGIVVDPFAGGGSTLDVCRKRLRRCYLSDRKPIPARADQIRRIDVLESLPKLGKRWADVSLTYMDPPYWKQIEGQYSEDDEDLANMTLENFTTSLAAVIKNIGKKQSKGVVALLIRPTQWKSKGRRVVDHAFDLISAVGDDLKYERRISCPTKGVMATPPMIEWAKENKELLAITREVIIWRV